MASSLRDLLSYFLHLIFFVVSNIYTFFAYVVWMTLLTPLRILAPSVYWKLEKEIFYWLVTVCVSWINFGGYKVIECGDDVATLHDQECLLLCNHQSTGDVPLVMLALHNKKMAAAKVMWVIYRLYKYSNFGLVCWHRLDYFIDVGKAVRLSEMAKFKNHLVNCYLNLKKKWIVVFPEGGFLCREKEICQRYAKKNNLPQLEHVLLPRVGAVKVVLDTVGERFDEAQVNEHEVTSDPVSYENAPGYLSSGRSPTTKDIKDNNSNGSKKNGHSNGLLSVRQTTVEDPSRPVKWIIDMTIAYKDKEPLGLIGMSLGYAPHKDILVHWKAYRVKDIPRNEADLTSWLYQRYSEKEEMLETYYKEGKMPRPLDKSSFPQKQPKYIRYNLTLQLLVNAALFVLFYLQYAIIFKPFTALVAFLWNSVFQFQFVL